MHDVDKPCKAVLREQPYQFDTLPDGVFYLTAAYQFFRLRW